jgi:ornithine cyclodeaminase/alanine dehydrogenase-like protein (mu-crystallin family)
MDSHSSIVVLDEPAVQQRLHYQDLIPAIAEALAALSAGRVVQPVRAVLPIAPHQGFFGVMPAYAGSLGAKLVTFYPKNVGVHTHHALIVMFKPETGEPRAVLDGRLITEMRTAAASAVATDRLARADASVLAILGSGVQAKSHLAALRESGDVIASKQEVTEIGAVVSGRDPGRRNAQEITLFKSVGVAVEDVAAAALVLQQGA